MSDIGSAGTAPKSTAAAKTVLRTDFTAKRLSLEDVMSKLDEVGVEYSVRVQGSEGTILKDPKSSSEKGKWIVQILLDGEKASALAKDELRAGDRVQILVKPTLEPTPTPTPSVTQPAGRTITFVITADGPILNTTFGKTIGGSLETEQANGVASPFTKEYFLPSIMEGQRNFFSTSAQAGEGTTTISCQIASNGTVISKQTSTGPYAVVSCSS